MFVGFSAPSFNDAIFLMSNNSYFFEAEFLPIIWKLAPLVTSFFFFFIIIFGFDCLGNLFFILFKCEAFFYILRSLSLKFVDFFLLNWYFDFFFNYNSIFFFFFCKNIFYKLLDKNFLEFFGPHSIIIFFSICSRKVSVLISGYLFHYTFLILLGISWFFVMNIFLLNNPDFEFLFLQFFFFINFVFILNKLNF